VPPAPQARRRLLAAHVELVVTGSYSGSAGAVTAADADIAACCINKVCTDASICKAAGIEGAVSDANTGAGTGEACPLGFDRGAGSGPQELAQRGQWAEPAPSGSRVV
jgi:hypothetical protein